MSEDQSSCKKKKKSKMSRDYCFERGPKMESHCGPEVRALKGDEVLGGPSCWQQPELKVRKMGNKIRCCLCRNVPTE